MHDFIDRFKHVFSKYHDHIAVIDHLNDTTYSYAELEQLSAHLAGYLSQQVTSGDCIAMIYHNEFELVLGYYACIHLQVTLVPINPALHQQEIMHILDNITPKIVVTHESIRTNLNAEGHRFVTFGNDDDALALSALSEQPRYKEAVFSGLQEDYLALIMHTSGSTGAPKAIPITAHALIGNCLAMEATRLYGTPSLCYYMIPTSYIGGIVLMLSHFSTGGSMLLDEAFSPKSAYRYWATILERSVETLWLTPTMVSTLLAIGIDEDTPMEDVRKSVKRAIVFTGPIATDVKMRFEELFGIRLQKFLGITETLQCCHWDDDLDTPVESVGKPLPGVDVKIADENDVYLKAHEEGEIRIGGDWIFKEYWQQPEITKHTFDRFDYYKSGDLGYFDDEGHLFISGRIKDTIKCGGLNVAPAEVENAILHHPKIKEAAVIGVEHEMYGEMIVAFVSTIDHEEVSTQDVISVCSAHIMSQKIPSRVEFLPELPHNLIGKIDKRSLKETFIKSSGNNS